MLGINTNVASLTSQRNLASTSNAMSTTLQRLSSGLRINSAKDDAAGLAISERMGAQIRGLDQARRNANDGISMAQTAEGALVEVTNNLQRIRELSVQSANASNSDSDRQAIQGEVDQLLSEIDRVGKDTEFNGIKLLDGSFTSQSFQVGANAGQTIGIDSISSARTDDITRTSYAGTAGAAVGANFTGLKGDGDLTINGINIKKTATGSAKDVAYAINNSGVNGVTATAKTETAALTAADPTSLTAADGGLKINGVDIADATALAAVGDMTTNATNTQKLVDLINKKTAETGVRAELDKGV